MLRMPEGMRDRIAESAKANNRSMNAEIISRLQQTFEPTTFALGSLTAVVRDAVREAAAEALADTIVIERKGTP